MEKLIRDENGHYTFDFSKCIEVFQYHDIANSSNLNDVDFIAEMESSILFIEYKNSDVPGASNPSGLFDKRRSNPHEFNRNIINKFLHSIIILWAECKNPRNKPIHYVFIINEGKIDRKIRFKIKRMLISNLPFNLRGGSIKKEVITSVEVVNLEEFKQKYTEIPVTANFGVEEL